MNRKILSVIVVLGLLAGTILSYASTTLMQIGRSPFYQPSLTTVEFFQKTSRECSTLDCYVYKQSINIVWGYAICQNESWHN